MSIGYEKKCFTPDKLLQNHSTIELSPGLSLREVTVKADKLKASDGQIGHERLSIAQLKKLPMLLGEFDVLKAIQLLPGVKAGAEGQSGFYVRGGSPDQNLILLDGVPVYNVEHLFGFFSIFNDNSIKDVDFIKGGFPSRYGGRLSSVVDIRLKEGNNKKLHGVANVGLLSSSFMLEGPIRKDKTSFLITGRRTYLDFLFKQLLNRNRPGSYGYYFYDGTAKINHKINNKNQIFLSFYGGRDQLYTSSKLSTDDVLNESKFGLGWTNRTASLRWNKIWGTKFFSNINLTYTNYFLNDDRFDQSTNLGTKVKESYTFNYKAFIEDKGVKWDNDYILNSKVNFKFGANFVSHSFSPGLFKFRDDLQNNAYGRDTVISNKQSKPIEGFSYVESNIKFSNFITANVGVHASFFDLGNSISSSFQPRLALNAKINQSSSLKLGVTKMRQYIQILINDGLGYPIDLWVPATDKVKPQDSWLYSIGFAKDINESYSLTTEAYYKTIKNNITYKEGKGIYGLEDWQDKVTQGQGESFGLELLIKKNTGKLTGWLGYTLSKSSIQFDNVNNGRWYPLKYDRRHDLSLVSNYQLSKNKSISATWVYGTGTAYTLPASSYLLSYGPEDNPTIFDLSESSERNNYRLRPYHRLDIGYNVKYVKANHTRTLSFGAYNAYSRSNPIYAQTKLAQLNNKKVLIESSLFPIIPYISYKIEF